MHTKNDADSDFLCVLFAVIPIFVLLFTDIIPVSDDPANLLRTQQINFMRPQHMCIAYDPTVSREPLLIPT